MYVMSAYRSKQWVLDPQNLELQVVPDFAVLISFPIKCLGGGVFKIEDAAETAQPVKSATIQTFTGEALGRSFGSTVEKKKENVSGQSVLSD